MTWEEFSEVQLRNGLYTSGLPLNPLDVPEQPQIFDLLSMPPVSLVLNAQVESNYYELLVPNKVQLPAGMQYFLEKPQK